MSRRQTVLTFALVPVVVGLMLTASVLSRGWDIWVAWRGVKGCPP